MAGQLMGVLAFLRENPVTSAATGLVLVLVGLNHIFNPASSLVGGLVSGFIQVSGPVAWVVAAVGIGVAARGLGELARLAGY